MGQQVNQSKCNVGIKQIATTLGESSNLHLFGILPDFKHWSLFIIIVYYRCKGELIHFPHLIKVS